jgi:hypothetical protein
MRFVEVKPVAFLSSNPSTEERDLFYFSACASRFIHFPNVVIYLFIRLAYSRRLPLDSVFDTRSLPAKSTILSIPFKYFVSPTSFQRCSTVTWITAWLRDDRLFCILSEVPLKSLPFFVTWLPYAYRKISHQLNALILPSNLWYEPPINCFPWFTTSYCHSPAGHKCYLGKIKRNLPLPQTDVSLVYA